MKETLEMVTDPVGAVVAPIDRDTVSEISGAMADRIFAVLEACAASSRSLTLTELVESTGLPKATVHRLCGKLVELRGLQRDAHGFHIGAKLFVIGSMSPTLRRLRMIGLPFMQELVAATGAFAYLGVMSDGKALVVEELCNGRDSAAMKGGAGTMIPLHATAMGKALIMHRYDEVLDTVALGRLRPYTRRTIVRTDILREHLRAARPAGVAVAREELSYRMGWSGVAAPIVVAEQTVASMALWGKFADSEVQTLSRLVRDVGDRFSMSLAGAPLV